MYAMLESEGAAGWTLVLEREDILSVRDLAEASEAQLSEIGIPPGTSRRILLSARKVAPPRSAKSTAFLVQSVRGRRVPAFDLAVDCPTLLLRAVRYYAISGTDIGYAATRYILVDLAAPQHVEARSEIKCERPRSQYSVYPECG
eukprot:3014932-Rhodomonas_salina.1